MNKTVKLTIPTPLICDFCARSIASEDYVWLRGTWDCGVQTKSEAYHINCIPLGYREWDDQ